MQKNIPLSLSIQREIEKHRLNMESEIDKSMDKLGFLTILDRSIIRTEVLLEMLQRCFRNGIDARFVLFDSWFANDGLLANIVDIGHRVICRLKATKTRYNCQGPETKPFAIEPGMHWSVCCKPTAIRCT